MKRFELAERDDQRFKFRRTDPLRHDPLSARPVRLGGLQHLRAFARQRHLARAGVVSADDLDQTLLDKWVEVSRQRRAIEKLDGCKIADAMRSLARQRAQQRELREAQARRRQQIIVELRQRARGTAEAATGAGRRGAQRTIRRRVDSHRGSGQQEPPAFCVR